MISVGPVAGPAWVLVKFRSRSARNAAAPAFGLGVRARWVTGL